MENDELMHYGVKGMKWGVRRTPERLFDRVKRKAEDRKFRREYDRDMRRAKRDHRRGSQSSFEDSFGNRYGRELDIAVERSLRDEVEFTKLGRGWYDSNDSWTRNTWI